MLLKDMIIVGGYDMIVGYSLFVGNDDGKDGVMVRMLKDMGVVLYVKMNCLIMLLSFESGNDVWGRVENLFKKGYSFGGSMGGESVLLVMGGSRIGVGSDVVGSVRLLVYWVGCYVLRCLMGRWFKVGIKISMFG